MFYTVSVQSTGYSADWVDDLIVRAETEQSAKHAAEKYVVDHFPDRHVERDNTEAYPLDPDGPEWVAGRLINSDEE